MNLPVVVQWSFDLSDTPSALRGGKLIFAALNVPDRSILYAFTPDGRELWSHRFEHTIISGLETSNDLILIALSSTDLLHSEGRLLALNENGEEAWLWVGDVQRVSAPAVAEYRVCFTADGKTLVRLDATTGEEKQRWRLPVPASSTAPLIVGEVAYIACHGPQVLAYHLNQRMQWQYTHADPAAWLDQTPVAIGDLLVVVSSRGEALILDRQSGALRQRAAIGSTDKPLSAPTVGGSSVWLGAHDGLYQLEVQSAHVKQWLKTERRIEAAPVVVGDVVYVTCHDHHLYALDRATGRELWRWTAARRIEIAPLFLPDSALIIVADHFGHVTALRRPLAAGELAQAGRRSEAADAYADDTQLARQADALVEYARQLESQHNLEQAGQIWEKATQLFTQLDQPERAQLCQKEQLRCWEMPVLAVEIQAGDLHVNEWSVVELTMRNDGYGPAHNIIVHAEGEQFAGRVMDTQRIATLPVGHTQTDQLDLKPLDSGRVPLRLHFDYADRRGTRHAVKHTLHVTVARPEEASRSEGVHIEAEKADIGGDVVGRDKIILVGNNVIFVSPGGRLEFDGINAPKPGATEPETPPSSVLPAAGRESLQKQLNELHANLQLIEERKAEYVLGVDVPLQLIKEERRLRDKIAELEAELHGASRDAT